MIEQERLGHRIGFFLTYIYYSFKFLCRTVTSRDHILFLRSINQFRVHILYLTRRRSKLRHSDSFRDISRGGTSPRPVQCTALNFKSHSNFVNVKPHPTFIPPPAQRPQQATLPLASAVRAQSRPGEASICTGFRSISMCSVLGILYRLSTLSPNSRSVGMSSVRCPSERTSSVSLQS